MTKVVVLEKFKKNWEIGSVVSVKDGYARNYLVPNGKAKFATKENILEIKSLEDSLLKKDDENKSNANKTAAKINELKFTKEDLSSRYEELSPKGQVDLVVIGCPQASVGEVRATAAAVRGRMEFGEKISDQRLWVFTSGRNHELLEQEGTLDVLEEAGVLILKDKCPVLKT